LIPILQRLAYAASACDPGSPVRLIKKDGSRHRPNNAGELKPRHRLGALIELVYDLVGIAKQRAIAPRDRRVRDYGQPGETPPSYAGGHGLWEYSEAFTPKLYHHPIQKV
jgi:hypothetical protein